MAKVGGILNKKDDDEAFKQEIILAQKAIHKQWVNQEDSTYTNGEQPYLIFPLQTGITPDELKDAVFENT